MRKRRIDPSSARSAIDAFWEWDPVGLTGLSDSDRRVDDYDELARTVLAKIESGVAPDDVTDWLLATFSRDWGVDPARQDAASTVARITALRSDDARPGE